MRRDNGCDYAVRRSNFKPELSRCGLRLRHERQADKNMQP